MATFWCQACQKYQREEPTAFDKFKQILWLVFLWSIIWAAIVMPSGCNDKGYRGGGTPGAPSKGPGVQITLRNVDPWFQAEATVYGLVVSSGHPKGIWVKVADVSLKPLEKSPSIFLSGPPSRVAVVMKQGWPQHTRNYPQDWKEHGTGKLLSGIVVEVP